MPGNPGRNGFKGAKGEAGRPGSPGTSGPGAFTRPPGSGGKGEKGDKGEPGKTTVVRIGVRFSFSEMQSSFVMGKFREICFSNSAYLSESEKTGNWRTQQGWHWRRLERKHSLLERPKGVSRRRRRQRCCRSAALALQESRGVEEPREAVDDVFATGDARLHRERGCSPSAVQESVERSSGF